MRSDEKNDLAFFVSGTLCVLVGAYLLDGLGGFLLSFGLWALGGCALTRVVGALRPSPSYSPKASTQDAARSDRQIR